jgi:hypothetical protein
MPHPPPSRRRYRARLTLAAALVLLTGVFLLQAWLPGRILARYHALSLDMGAGHRGAAGHVKLDWFAPGYSLHEVRITRDAGPPLLEARELRIRLHPLGGDSEVSVHGLALDLDAGADRLGAGVPWRRYLDALAPRFAPSSVELVDARILLRLEGIAQAPIEIDALDLRLDGLDLTPDASRPAPARITGEARLLQHAPLRVEGVFDPAGPMQRLNLKLSFDALALERLDPYARLWRGIDFEAGRGAGELRLSSSDTRVRGGLVATLTDVDVFDAREDLGRDGDGLLRAARELIAGGAAVLGSGGGPLRVEQALDRQVPLAEDNFEGLRAVLEAGLAALPAR